jgi:hypothetical protein
MSSWVSRSHYVGTNYPKNRRREEPPERRFLEYATSRHVQAPRKRREESRGWLWIFLGLIECG